MGLTGDRFGQLLRLDVLEFTDGTGSLKVDHVALVTQPPFEQLDHLALHTALSLVPWNQRDLNHPLGILLDNLRGEPNEHAQRHGILQRRSSP